jgi:hypothetical protein
MWAKGKKRANNQGFAPAFGRNREERRMVFGLFAEASLRLPPEQNEPARRL